DLRIERERQEGIAAQGASEHAQRCVLVTCTRPGIDQESTSMSETSESSSPAPAPATKARPKRAKRPREPWDRTWLRVAASALCGVFMFMGAPDPDICGLGFIGWVPWVWSFEGLSPKRAFLVGWVAGFVAVFVGHFWMTELLTRFAGLPDTISIPILALFALFHGMQWGVPAAVIVWLRRRTARRSAWAAPMA